MLPTTLAPTTTTALVHQDLVDQTNDYVRQAKAANTLRAYRADWRDFESWCLTHERAALPANAETVAYYLTDLAERCKISTLQRRLSAISQAHQAAGQPTPTTSVVVRATWAGIRRAKGSAQQGKAPIAVRELRAMLDGLPDSLLGRRDRALLLLGFAAALRRSELVGLDVADVAITTDGLALQLRRSKTDQAGEGRKIGVPYGSYPASCPVRAVQGWLALSGLEAGPLFRPVDRHGRLGTTRLSDKAVALVVKRCAQAAGLDSVQYAGHSLRAGLATAAAAAGASERAIMAQTGHRSVAIMRRYIRDGSLFRENAAAVVGL